MENEKRLIDANAVPKLFEKKYEETEQRILDGATYLDTLAEGFTEADDVILSMPTVDAVEVVRCKDCKHWRENTLWCDMNSRDRGENFNWYEDDFCSYGERKDNG